MRIDNEVLAVLSVAETEGNNLILTGQLSRDLYLRTNKIIEACGGKWNKKAKAHIFDKGAIDRLDEILLTGEVEIPKDEFNYFPSPPAVVARLMELADVQDGMAVLEPSAGRGAIVNGCLNSGAIVDCCELMRENYLYLCEHTKARHVKPIDFLTLEKSQDYDRVVMNPPFLKQADIKHVLHALGFLKSDGLLVSVMSAGVTFRDNKLTKEFRELVEQRGGTIEALPEAAFKESGTMVRTVIVTIPA